MKALVYFLKFARRLTNMHSFLGYSTQKACGRGVVLVGQIKSTRVTVTGEVKRNKKLSRALEADQLQIPYFDSQDDCSSKRTAIEAKDCSIESIVKKWRIVHDTKRRDWKELGILSGTCECLELENLRLQIAMRNTVKLSSRKTASKTSEEATVRYLNRAAQA